MKKFDTLAEVKKANLEYRQALLATKPRSKERDALLMREVTADVPTWRSASDVLRETEKAYLFGGYDFRCKNFWVAKSQTQTLTENGQTWLIFPEWCVKI